MNLDARTLRSVVSVVEGRGEPVATELHVERRRIRGGMEAHRVERITARYCDRSGRRKRLSFVAKQLQGSSVREAHVYEALRDYTPCDISPRVYVIDHLQREQALLLLEDVPRSCTWPWRDPAASHAVLRRLGEFHAVRPTISNVRRWDYESELQRSAVATIELLETMRRSRDGFSLVKRSLRPLERIIDSLPSRRAALLRFQPHDDTTIHGDMHSGNVILRRRRGQYEPVFIDWARARSGSALEDVSSWLQSLGYWEPEARKRHDTLLRDYLRARGSEDSLPSDLRAAYWMAGASNALAGALRYHCWCAMNASTIRSRAAAAHAAAGWLRVIVRADALSG